MATVDMTQVGALIDERLAPVTQLITNLQGVSGGHQEALAAVGSRQRKILEQHQTLHEAQERQRLVILQMEGKIAEMTASMAATDEMQRTLMAMR